MSAAALQLAVELLVDGWTDVGPFARLVIGSVLVAGGWSE